MKGYLLDQPYATLAALGELTILTANFDPFTCRFQGCQGDPTCPFCRECLERGERIAIVAGAQPPTVDEWFGTLQVQSTIDGDYGVTNYNDTHTDQSTWHPLPLGAVVCTVTVDDALPIVNLASMDTQPESWIGLGGPNLHVRRNGVVTAAHDQLALGDFTLPFGWLLSDPQTPTKPCRDCGGVGWPNLKGMRVQMPCCSTGRVPADPIPYTPAQSGLHTLPDDIEEMLR